MTKCFHEGLVWSITGVRVSPSDRHRGISPAAATFVFECVIVMLLIIVCGCPKLFLCPTFFSARSSSRKSSNGKEVGHKWHVVIISKCLLKVRSLIPGNSLFDKLHDINTCRTRATALVEGCAEAAFFNNLHSLSNISLGFFGQTRVRC